VKRLKVMTSLAATTDRAISHAVASRCFPLTVRTHEGQFLNIALTRVARYCTPSTGWSQKT